MKQVYIIKNNLVMVDLINDHKSRIEMEINCSHCKLLIYEANPHYWEYKGKPVLLLGASDEDNLFNTGILDSAGLLHFVGFIEKKFELNIPDEDLIPEKFTSITSIASYIRSRIQEPAIMN